MRISLRRPAAHALGMILLFPMVICAQSDDFAARLRDAVDQTRAELQAERARMEKEKQARELRLQQTRTASRELAKQIVERRMAVERRKAQLRTARQQRESLWTERTRWQADLSQVRLICEEIERELSEFLSIIPVTRRRAEHQDALDELRRAIENDRPRMMIERAFAVIAALLEEARSTDVYPAQITDPHGVRRQAQLLRIGWNLFAWRIRRTSRTAIAIADPYKEGGFRWHENLSEPMARAVADAIGRSDSQTTHWLPIDVTGSMTADTGLSDRTVEQRLRAGGVVMFPLAAVALCLAILILERLIVLLPERRHSVRFYERILELVNSGDFEQAEQLAGRSRGVVSRTLKVCLAHRNSRPEVLDDLIQETFLHEFPKLERFLPSIRMLSSVAPILGLLGTVTGIIATFDMITVVGAGKPRLMAGGISEALITTATGLIIAIPGLLAHSFLAGRINGIIADTERFAATLSNLLKQHQKPAGSKAKGGPKP